MVSSFGGALQVIGVRAVINDLNKYLNDSKRIEAANEGIFRASQRLEAQSAKTAAAQLKQAAGPSAAFQASAANRIAAGERAIESAQAKLQDTTRKLAEQQNIVNAGRNVSQSLLIREANNTRQISEAKAKLVDILNKERVAQTVLSTARITALEAENKAVAIESVQRNTRLVSGSDLIGAGVRSARAEAVRTAAEVTKAENSLTKLRADGQKQVELIRDGELKLLATRKLISEQTTGGAVRDQARLISLRQLEQRQSKELQDAISRLAGTRLGIAAQAQQVDIRNEEALVAARTAEQAATERLELSQKKLANSRFAGLKSAALATGIVGAFATAGTIVASTSAASKYEDVLVRIDNFTEATTEEVARLNEEFVKMSKTIPLQAVQLAEGSYFALSSGIQDVNLALQITEQAAKLATASNSELNDVITFATRTINAYGSANITASQAIDILSAGILEGSAAPRDFANQLARTTGIASQLNIPLDQLAATFATLSNVLPSEQAGTGLLGILNQLISPSEQAITQLEKLGYGLTTGGDAFLEFRNIIAERGLPEALNDLSSRITNIQQLGEIFPEVRGFNAFLQVFKTGGSEVDRILNQIRNSAGITDQQFQKYSETASAQAKILKNQLNTVFIQLGNAILPAVIVQVRYLIEWIQKNNESIQKFVREALLWLINTFKIAVQIIGALSGVLATIVGQEHATKAALLGIGGALTWALPGGPLIKGLTTIVGLVGLLSSSGPSNAARDSIFNALKNKGEDEIRSAETRIRQAEQLGLSKTSSGSTIDEERKKIEEYKKTLSSLTSDFEEQQKALEDNKEAVIELGEIKLPNLTNNVNDVAMATDDAAAKFKNFKDILDDGIISFEEATKVDWEGKIKGYTAAMAGGIEAMEGLRLAEEEAARKAFEFEKALAKVAATFVHSEREAQKLVLTQARATLEALNTASATLLGRPSREEADLSLQRARANLFQVQTNQRIDPQLEAAEDFKKARDKALKAELDLAKEIADARKEAMDDELEALEDRLDNLKEANEDEIESLEDRANALDEELDIRDEFLEGLKQRTDDELREMDRRRQLRERDLDDAVEALNKQKDYLKDRQDLAISPSEKKAIQKQIDAIDSEIESRQHADQAARRIEEDREFQLKEEQIARDREEEERQDALKRQIDSIDEEIEARKRANEREEELLEDRIKSLKKSHEAEERAIEDSIEQLEKSTNSEIQRIDELIQSYQDQKDQAGKLTKFFQDQIDLIEAQKGIWQAEQVAADATLMSLAEVEAKHYELAEMTTFASTQVVGLSRALGEELLPEIKDAKEKFFLLTEQVGILTDSSIRDKFIPQVDYAAEHARLLAEAAAAAAERLESSTKAAGAGILGAAAQMVREAEAAGADYRTAMEQIEVSQSMLSSGGYSGSGGGGFGGGSGGVSPYVGPLASDVYDAVERWRDLVAEYFPPSEVQRALNVMALESGGNPSAAKDDDIESSYGLFQINTDVHPLTPTQAKNARINVAFASKLFQEQGWRPWTAARQLGYAERGALVTSPRIMMMGEHNKPEMILPLTNIARSRELMGRISPGIRAQILGSSVGANSSTNITIGQINLPNADGRTFIPQLEDYMSRKLRLQKRGVTYG